MTKQEILRQLSYQEGVLRSLDVGGEFESPLEEISDLLNMVYTHILEQEENTQCQRS